LTRKLSVSLRVFRFSSKTTQVICRFDVVVTNALLSQEQENKSVSFGRRTALGSLAHTFAVPYDLVAVTITQPKVP
jgi:hypothetical protein